MEKQVKFGLIGKNISYSFSRKYFENKFRNQMLEGYSYELFDLNEISQVENIFTDASLKGFNVTIPYKQQIVPFLDELSEEAEETGAVNCVLIKNGKKKGFNTDVYGFEKTLLLHRTPEQQKALILGNGGAAKAVQFVLNKYGIPYQNVTRNGDFLYEKLTPELVQEHTLIIQCTPVGTFPETENCLPFPFEGLNENHLVIDLIYNPNYTKFIRNAAEKGARTVNGFYMLEQQAEKSWQIWNS